MDSNVLLDVLTRDTGWAEWSGAHAAVTGMPLLTRDASRYRTYFPGLELIAP